MLRKKKIEKHDSKIDPIFPRREWTKADIQELIDLWKIIPSVHLLSLILKRAPSAIQTQASRSGLNKSAVIDVSHLRRRWTKVDDELLKELVNNYRKDGMGLPIFDISKAVNRSIDSTVNRIVYLYNDKYIIREIKVPKTIHQVEKEFKTFIGSDSEANKEIKKKKSNSIERKCLSCGRIFVSPDKKRIWRCQVCKGTPDDLDELEYYL